MIRELFISLYLFLFHLVFNICKLFPQKDRTIFVSYLGFNVEQVVEYMEKYTVEELIVVQTKHTLVDFKAQKSRVVLDVSRKSPKIWLSFIFYLATSNKVIVDNYYPFLSVTNFKKEAVCIQLWHAAGALKKFGLLDLAVPLRRKSAQKRFRRVYDRYDYVVVGSDKMADVFEECFGTTGEKILQTGIPRTDFFFDRNKVEAAREDVYRQIPALKDKKVILYAPTFRDNQFTVNDYALDIKRMERSLGEGYVLLVKNHPLVVYDGLDEHSHFCINVSDYKNINHLLTVTDILISDYSSIPFEFALLERPMIFYAYDLEQYETERGLWSSYQETVPGPIARTTDEVIHLIGEDNFDLSSIKRFKEEWNTYSDGHACEKLYHFLQNKK